MRIQAALAVLLTACSATSQRRPSGSESPAPSPISPVDVAIARNSTAADQLDSLLASVLSLDARFVEIGEGFQYTGETDSSFQRLVRNPLSVRRLVDCLGWDRRSAATYEGAPVLVGTVCELALAATPYVESRYYPDRLSPDIWMSGWIDYRNPPIEKLRSAQKAWTRQLRRDPP